MSAANLDSRTVGRARLALVLAAAAAFGVAYLFSEEFRSEVGRAVGILGRGDVEGVRDYILSFGPWAPVVSALLMVLQGLVSAGAVVAAVVGRRRQGRAVPLERDPEEGAPEGDAPFHLLATRR